MELISVIERNKLISIIKDIEATIVGKVYADLMYRHDGFGRPTSHKYLSEIHAELISLPSMISVDNREKELCKKFDYELSPLFRTIEEMEERGKEIFNEEIKEKEGNNLEL